MVFFIIYLSGFFKFLFFSVSHIYPQVYCRIVFLGFFPSVDHNMYVYFKSGFFGLTGFMSTTVCFLRPARQ